VTAELTVELLKAGEVEQKLLLRDARRNRREETCLWPARFAMRPVNSGQEAGAFCGDCAAVNGIWRSGNRLEIQGREERPRWTRKK